MHKSVIKEAQHKLCRRIEELAIRYRKEAGEGHYDTKCSMIISVIDKEDEYNLDEELVSQWSDFVNDVIENSHRSIDLIKKWIYYA